jgi:NitT/TauT family transport system substrate-binding protein
MDPGSRRTARGLAALGRAAIRLRRTVAASAGPCRAGLLAARSALRAEGFAASAGPCRAGLLAAILVLGCDGGAEGRLTLALNWKPEPEFGGLFEAERSGAFARRSLDVEITGGPGAPVVQMVAAGRADYGIASADEVVIARDRGSDVVAIFATYQTSPQGIMVHASRGLDRLEDVFSAGGRLAVEPGLPYVKFLESRYDLSSLEIVPYGYSVAPFLTDPAMAQQVFVTAEPIAARSQGADPRVFLVAESGYNPYTAVVISDARRVRDRPGEVAALVDALQEGWRGYLDDPEPTNRRMQELNREMDAETFRLGAAAQKALIEDDTTRRFGLGHMTRERWATLARQLRELALIDSPPQPDACFVNPARLGAAGRP